MGIYRRNSGGGVVVKNTFMQYVLYIAQMLFPFITLPYLTRVLNVADYGIYTYSGTCMTYITLIINYGFILSATRDIVNANGDKAAISRIHSRVIMAKSLLTLFSSVVLVGMLLWIEVLRGYELFLFLMFIGTVLNAFLPDYLFRGIEKMEVITYRFLICKTLTTALTFVLVRDQSDYMMLPVLNIISGAVALILSLFWERREGYGIRFVPVREGLSAIKSGFLHFVSQSASTAFNAMNTFIIGLFFGATEIAYWGAAVSLISAAQGLYGPISSSLYPHMIKTKKISLIKKVFLFFMPCIIAVAAACFFLSDFIIGLLYGEQYVNAIWIFEVLLLVLVLAFPAVMLGWPTLGAISKAKEITFTSLTSAGFQIVALLILGFTGNFTMLNVCIVRVSTEAMLLLSRCFFCIKYRKEFN